MSDTSVHTYKFGSMEAAAPKLEDLRMSILLWSPPGGKKTTLASTAPGKKLWLNFDPDGYDSIRARAEDLKDIIILDFSGERHTIIPRFMEEDPFNIGRELAKHPEITTLVVDSLTAFAEMAMDSTIADPKNKNSTITSPGMNGYSHRNALVKKAFVNLLRLTKKHNKHFIVTCHEKEEVVGEEVTGFTLSLSTSLIGQLGLQAGEIWYLMNTDKGDPRILVKPGRKRSPMKTRMFVPDMIEFDWKYNPTTYEGTGIETWFNAWKDAGGRKIDPRTL